MKPIGFYIDSQNQVIEITPEMIKTKQLGIFKTDNGDAVCLLENTIWNQYQVIAEFKFYPTLDVLTSDFVAGNPQ